MAGDLNHIRYQLDDPHKYSLPLDPKNPWKNEGLYSPQYMGFFTPKNEETLGSHG